MTRSISYLITSVLYTILVNLKIIVNSNKLISTHNAWTTYGKPIHHIVSTPHQTIFFFFSLLLKYIQIRIFICDAYGVSTYTYRQAINSNISACNLICKFDLKYCLVVKYDKWWRLPGGYINVIGLVNHFTNVGVLLYTKIILFELLQNRE